MLQGLKQHCHGQPNRRQTTPSTSTTVWQSQLVVYTVQVLLGVLQNHLTLQLGTQKQLKRLFLELSLCKTFTVQSVARYQCNLY